MYLREIYCKGVFPRSWVPLFWVSEARCSSAASLSAPLPIYLPWIALAPAGHRTPIHQAQYYSQLLAFMLFEKKHCHPDDWLPRLCSGFPEYPELEPQVFSSYHVDTRKGTWVSCKMQVLLTAEISLSAPIKSMIFIKKATVHTKRSKERTTNKDFLCLLY